MKKVLVLGIIALFIGMSIAPSIGTNVIKKSKTNCNSGIGMGDKIIFLAVVNSYDNSISIFHSDGVGEFNHYEDYPVGDLPSKIVTDDFNFDGVPDLAITNYRYGDVSILLGNGFGGFVSHQLYPSVSSPGEIATDDFNNDGVLDLAVVDSDHEEVSILLGDSFGGFGKPQEFPTGIEPEGIATGDFNEDGNIDFAVTNDEMFGEPGTVDIFLGDGTGSFSFHEEHDVYNVPYSVVAGDFNMDSNIDLVVTHLGGGYSLVLLGDGNGGFSSGHDFSTGSYAFGIAVDDFNCDDILDVGITKGNEGTVSTFLGDGTGMFINRTDYSIGTDPRGVATGDFNGDSQPDLVVVNKGDDDISVFLGDGNGGFDNRLDYPVGDEPKDVVTGIITIAEPGLEIGGISRGIAQVKVEIKNIGETDFTNVKWKISVLSKGLLNLIEREIASSHGIIPLLAADDCVIVDLSPVLGLLSEDRIVVTASTYGGGTTKKIVKWSDVYDFNSVWSEFTVAMSRNKATYNSFFSYFIERFPLLKQLFSICS